MLNTEICMTDCFKIIRFKMLRFLSVLLFALFFNSTMAQQFTGQWKGEFVDNSTSFVGWGGDRCEYVLELETKGTKVTGYSYTYFSDGGKRYYTICRLEGTVKPQSKYVEVTEVERTKTNVPTTIRNCFQVHRLTFFKAGSEEKLEGNWVPAPNQQGECGFGTTSLSRRVLNQAIPKYNNATARNGSPKTNKLPDLRDKNKIEKPVAIAPAIKKPVVSVPVAKNTIVEKQNIEASPAPLIKKDQVIPEQVPDNNLEKRNNSLIKTIELENQTFKVDLYDNGDIDGDSISLIYNGRILLSHKRLTDKPITLSLNADNDNSVNELVMYAENLGEIPPNTALMIVTDGNNRYEVRITSDLQKSGTIKFIHKPKNPQ